MKKTAALTLAFVLCGAPRSASAQSCDVWVQLDFVEPLTELDTHEVRIDLTAELAPRDIGVCTAGEGSPLARIRVESEGESGGRVRIRVEDQITDKRLERDLTLADLPLDARPLTVALAIAELLRASWIELRLREAHRAARPPPPQVEEVVTQSLDLPATESLPAGRLSLLGSVDWFSAGTTLFGADLRYAHRIGGPIGFHLGIGGRAALPVRTELGTVDAAALWFGAGLRVEFTPPEWDASLALDAGVDGYALRFEGSTDGSARTSSDADVAIAIAAALVAALRLAGPLLLEARVGLSVPVRTFRAGAGDTPVAGIAEVGVGGALGLVLAL